MLSDKEKQLRLQKALEFGGPTHRVSDVIELIQQGKAQLWERGDGIIVTEISKYPLMKTIGYWLVLGELRDCLGLQDEIDEWARGEGCDVATASGRRGWCRAAAGWQLDGYSYRKPLSPFWSVRS